MNSPLDIDDLERAAAPMQISLDPATRERVATCREFVRTGLEDGRPIYGSTTGFGPLVTFGGRANSAEQCENVLAHLTAGQGADLEPRMVRAAMLARLWSLCKARSGVSLAVVDSLADALRTDFTPAVPRTGSLGASGDLIPLAYIARALRGDGHAYHDGVRVPATDGLRRYGLGPVELDGRDALAMVNGTSVTAAAAGLAAASLRRSRSVALALTALLADVLGCSPAFLDPNLLASFGHRHVAGAGQILRGRLDGLEPSGHRPLQEPYSIRCTPQLVGAASSALDYACEVIRDDINGISDNPLFFPEHDLVTHGGNFFGQPVAFAADLLSLVATQLGNLAERQIDLMIDPHRNGNLAPMLSAAPGEQHGMQGVQVAATAIVATMRRSAPSASAQSLPTNLHNQDVVPLGTLAALNALDMAGNLRLLLGSLAVTLRQAVYVGARRPTAPACSDLLDQLSEAIPPVDPDRPLDEDVRHAADLLDQLGHAHLTGNTEGSEI
nr:aromatic amino acid ammonia-lyase [Phytoactinopolyspora halophila]